MIQLVGKITGLTETEYKHNFAEMEKLAKEKFPKEHVFNPAKLGDIYGVDRSWEFYMSICLSNLLYADCIVIHPNWKTSKGARAEVTVAKLLNKKMLNYKNKGVKC